MREDEVTETGAVKKESTPTIWAVGGGKGGVGKSIMSSLLAFWLARLGNRTILMDLDLGGGKSSHPHGHQDAASRIKRFYVREIWIIGGDLHGNGAR